VSIHDVIAAGKYSLGVIWILKESIFLEGGNVFEKHGRGGHFVGRYDGAGVDRDRVEVVGVFVLLRQTSEGVRVELEVPGGRGGEKRTTCRKF